MRMFRKVLGFGALPVLLSLSPLLLLPVIARLEGPSGWAAFVVGQSVGNFCLTAQNFGWNISGPPRIAMLPDLESRLSAFADVFWAKALIFPLVILAGLSATAALTPMPEWGVSLPIFFATSVIGFGTQWFGVGTGSPTLIARFEVLPRIGATLLALPAILLTSQVWIYPALLVFAMVVSRGSFNVKHYRSILPARRSVRNSIAELQRNSATAVVDMTTNLYNSAPVPIASALLPIVSVAGFASGDRLYRYSLFPLAAIGDSLQAWVLDPTSKVLQRRQLIGIGANMVFGVSAGLVLALLGPFFTSVLFGEAVKSSPEIMVWYGVCVAAVATSAPLIRNILIPAGKARLVLLATVVGAIVGLALMLVITRFLGAAGLALALAVSETIVLLIVAPAAITTLRRKVQEGSVDAISES